MHLDQPIDRPDTPGPATPEAARGGCPVCGSAQRSAVVEQNHVQVVRCRRCDHRYAWPVPSAEALRAIYDQSYYRGGHGSVGFRDYGALAAARRRMFARHLDRIEALIPPGRVLDVGCATGDFLLFARERDWQPLGVDPSPAREQARAAGVPICGETIQDADIVRGSLDLITFWDVLEHLPDPVADLRRAAQLLRRGGLVAATVPDAGSALARVSGRRWFGYKTAGEHLQFFSAATLRHSIAAAGLELVSQRPVAWTCTVAFVADRAALYLGWPGRVIHRACAGSPLAGRIIDVPQVNQFIIARRSPATPRDAKP